MSVAALLATLVALTLICLGTALWWWNGGRVASVWAVVESGGVVVAPPYSARVESVLVKEGDGVEARQPLVRMDVAAYRRRLRDAARETAPIRRDMPGVSARMEAVEAAERDIVTRLATARNEEETVRRLREQRVLEHVRAQLAVRDMDARGGPRVVGAAAHAKAVEEEAIARGRMEEAKEEFERTSRARAVLERELTAAREAALAGDDRDVRTPGAPMDFPVDGTLVAPVRGRVLRVLSRSGGELRRGEPALVVLPEGASEDGRGVLAFFPAGSAIGAGQACTVDVPGMGRVSGVVAQVPVDPASMGPTAGNVPKSGLEGCVAARISIVGPKPSGTPGNLVVCDVETRGTRLLGAIGAFFLGRGR
jgi:membrane fusion protein (multidrug efflux system)